MQLHLKAKEVAWSGLMMAFCIILIILSGVIETSSAFLLAAASFITGIIGRKFNLRISVLFAAGTFVLGFLVAPQKLYCFTFAGFSVYVIVAEYFREHNYGKVISIVVKGVCYHVLLVAALVMLKYFIGFDIVSGSKWLNSIKDIPVLLALIAIVAAEIMWFIFDRAYLFFQDRYGGRLTNVEY